MSYTKTRKDLVRQSSLSPEAVDALIKELGLSGQNFNGEALARIEAAIASQTASPKVESQVQSSIGDAVPALARIAQADAALATKQAEALKAYCTERAMGKAATVLNALNSSDELAERLVVEAIERGACSNFFDPAALNPWGAGVQLLAIAPSQGQSEQAAIAQSVEVV